jgi:serine/threonine protein kinase
MPERLPYDEAMLFSQVRLKIQDPELKQGKVEMMTIHTQRGDIERPWGVEGGFAVVYKFRTRSGNLRALRCFRVSINPDTQSRYERIGPYFHKHIQEITANFKYHEQGILVKEAGQPTGTVYPIIEMDWIDGVTLLDKVDELCQKRDRQALKAICNQWFNIIKMMNQAHIAHGDLAGLNVMFDTAGKMVLIDYDGVYIPEFAGLAQIVLGQIDYQHPNVAQRPFNEHMDAFSALAIYTALLALSVQPDLWDQYVQHDNQNRLLDNNLLWKQIDFQDTRQSPLFQELERSQDNRVQLFTRELKRACQQPIDQVRFPFHLIDPDYDRQLMWQRLEAAIQTNDDGQILQAWQPVLENYTPAQPHRARMDLARQRQGAQRQLLSALQSKDILLIANAYKRLEQQSWHTSLTHEHQLLGKIALNFIQACNNDNDEALLAAYKVLQRRPPTSTLNLTPEQRQKVQFAERRQLALQNFRDTLPSQDLRSIANAYKQLEQQSWHTLLAKDHLLLGKAAYNFIQAYDNDNDEALLAAYKVLQRPQHASLAVPTPEQLLRVQLAQQRKQALARLRQALQSKNARQIAAAYDVSLQISMEMTDAERKQVELALAFAQAYDHNNDAALKAAYDAIQTSPQQAFFVFSQEERERVVQAQARLEMLGALRQALVSSEVQDIATAYKLCKCHMNLRKLLSSAEIEQARLAYTFSKHFQNDQYILQAYDAIQRSPYKNTLHFTPEQEQRVQQLTLRKQAQQQLLTAITRKEKNAQEILSAYQDLQQKGYAQLPESQLQCVEQARQALQMRERVLQALQNDDEQSICMHYDRRLAEQFVNLFAERAQINIDGALQGQKLQQARKQAKKDGNYAPVIAILRNSRPSPKLRGQSWLVTALKNVLSRVELQAEVEIKSQPPHNQLLVSWDWPTVENIEIQYVILFWDAYREQITSDGFLSKARTRSVLRQFKPYKIVERQRNASNGFIKIDIAMATFMHIEMCAAMYDDWNTDAEEETWCFSPAIRFSAQRGQATSRSQ